MKNVFCWEGPATMKWITRYILPKSSTKSLGRIYKNISWWYFWQKKEVHCGVNNVQVSRDEDQGSALASGFLLYNPHSRVVTSALIISPGCVEHSAHSAQAFLPTELIKCLGLTHGWKKRVGHFYNIHSVAPLDFHLCQLEEYADMI